MKTKAQKFHAAGSLALLFVSALVFGLPGFLIMGTAIGATVPAVMHGQLCFDTPQFPTLLDVAKLDKGSAYDVIDEVIWQVPEVIFFPAGTQVGTTLDVTVLEALPGVAGSSFRRPNAGVLPTVAQFSNKSFEMAIFSRRVEVDIEGVLQKSKNQARVLVNQSKPQMMRVLQDIATQVWYGQNKDANAGFPGMISQYAADTLHEVDAGGQANDAGGLTSVWFLMLDEGICEITYGNDRSVTMSDNWKEETVLLALQNGETTNRRLRALTNWIEGSCGFRLMHKHRAVRIKNIGTANGTTLTDAMMYSALVKCEELGFRPTSIWGRSRSFEQLRTSRTTALLPNPPEIKEWESVPITKSINISLAESHA